MPITPILCSLTMLAAQTPALEPDLDVALGTVGLTTRTARFDQNLLLFFRQGKFTTPLYDATHENPWRMPFFADNLRRELAAAHLKPQDSLSAGMRMLGFQVRRSLVGNPNATIEEASKKPGALANVLADWKAKGYLTSAVPNVSTLPEEVQSAAALLLFAIPKALDARQLGIRNIGDVTGAYRRLTETPADPQGADFAALEAIYEKIDLAHLGAGAFDLLLACREAQARLGAVPAQVKYDVRLATRWGSIVLTGGSDTTHGEGSALLILDTGGNDTYLNHPSNRSEANPIGIVIDGQGNDRYLSDPRLAETSVAKWDQRSKGKFVPGPGGAVLGYSVLVDDQGDDIYRTHRPGIGSARCGVAVVMDRLGKDEFDAYQDGLGFAMFGFGMVDDAAGDDTYLGFNQVQGVGQTMGFGYLVDRAGDDVYTANIDVIDFPSAQSAQHNVNMAQGAGNGRRADYLDGHSLAGGVGLLYDLDGKDRYTCGVFGQGVGYWMGVGMLWDAQGSDTYTGQWYVHGASAHFAVGYLEDEAGNDQYLAGMNMALGAGHDFGFGMLIERAGDDTYKGPNLSLGAGNANGLGLFVDALGNDRYDSTGITLGNAAEAPKNSNRTRGLCLGVFMDLQGDDHYPSGASWAKNATRGPNIKDRGPTPAESQVGVFWDR
jgi:hypothetical protein